MPDKLCLLSYSHEIVSKTSFCHHLNGLVVQVLADDSRLGHGRYGFLYLQTGLMGRISLFAQFADGIYTAHVTHIAIEVAAHIHHETLSGLYQCTVGATGKRRIQSSPSQCKIIRRRSSGIVARQQAAHEYLHTLTEHTEDAETTFQTHQPFDLYGKLKVGHTRPVDRRNLFVGFGMSYARATEKFNLHLSLCSTCLTYQRRAARNDLSFGKAGCQAVVFPERQFVPFQHQFLG